jgi:hypothetical protein
VILLLFFGAMIVYVTENGEGKAYEPRQGIEEATAPDISLHAKLDGTAEKNAALERQFGDMSALVEELKLMVGAKGATREGFQEAIENLKRGYALCHKESNTLIEARIQNGAETVQVIGEIPGDLILSVEKGEETSDLEQIVSFIQDVYEYEKDHKCRFNYRLKYATDKDYRKAREVYEKYFYPEKILRTG